MSTTFARDSSLGLLAETDYSRDGTPIHRAAEAVLTALEGGSHSLLFASGMAAADAVLAILRPGERLVFPAAGYWALRKHVERLSAHRQFELCVVDTTDLDVVREAVRSGRTRLVWIESPANPCWEITDIEAVCSMARAAGALSCVDSTVATPLFTRPLELGADLVMHSATKYLGGHSDTLGGVLVTRRKDLAERLRFLQNAIGSVLSPFDSYLALRGVKTLAIRMRHHCNAALGIAEWLERHPKIEKVTYPGLRSHPQHALAAAQMRLDGRPAFGGMITIHLKGGLAESRRFLEEVRIFALAESLGGVESLIEHPAIMTHASVPPEARAELGISDSLVRLSIGIEDPKDLMADLDAALAKA
jgi:cystathionine gamma-lyase